MTSEAYDAGKAAGHKQGCGTVSDRVWQEYRSSVRDDTPIDFAVELAAFERGFADGVAAWKAEHPYSVLGFGSHPDDDNDDCFTGEDFATLDEARRAYLAVPVSGVAFVMLDGPDVNEIRQARKVRRRGTDDSWEREHAMQCGMALGVDGYNDAMGW